MALTVQKFQTVGPVEQDEDVENQNVHPNEIDMDRLYPRSGHRAVVDDSNMYVLGGYNPRFRHVENSLDTYYPLFKELWKFNFTTQKWTSLITDGIMPTELASHAALRCGRNLLYFGGTGVPFGHSSSNDFYTCNLDTLKWRYVKCRGDIPQKKYGHAMARLGKDVYVCGGTTGFVYNMDIHRLDIYTGVWEKLQVQSKYTPSSRYRHEIVSDDFRLYVFGGGTAHLAFPLDKIPAFEVQSGIWQETQTKPDKVHGYPRTRKCHSCSLFRNEAYVCGGLDGEDIMDDIWKLNLTTYEWTKIPTSLHLPVYFHSADITPDGCLYIFGGVTRIDDIRTNCVQRIWLILPTLQELCWENMCLTLDMKRLQKHRSKLFEIGVPMHFIERL